MADEKTPVESKVPATVVLEARAPSGPTPLQKLERLLRDRKKSFALAIRHSDGLGLVLTVTNQYGRQLTQTVAGRDDTLEEGIEKMLEAPRLYEEQQQ